LISAGLVLIVVFTILLFHRTYRLPSAVLLLVIVGVGLYFIPRTRFFEVRLKQLTAEDSLDENLRFKLWRPAVEMWRQNIWWGVGPDHFDYRFRAYRPQRVQREPGRVHNDYLNTLVDWGIVGAALVASALALLGAGVVKTWPYVRRSPGDLGSRQSNKFALVLGVSLGMLAIAIHSVVDFNMNIPANAILAVAWMAILTGCLRFASEQYWRTAHLGLKTAASLVLVSTVGYLAWEGTRCADEYVWRQRAARAPSFSAAQIDALKRAYAVEPRNFETAYDIGEAFRMQSWEGADNYAELATNAMQWFERSIKLNPYNSGSYLRYGMCLDWLGRLDEGQRKFEEAVHLDPNGYFTAAFTGWHYVQKQDYAAARVWLERSRWLQSVDNPVADSYLQIATRKLAEGATNVDVAVP
jgi:hypothetical protein